MGQLHLATAAAAAWNQRKGRRQPQSYRSSGRIQTVGELESDALVDTLADRVLQRVQSKLQRAESGETSSVSGSEGKSTTNDSATGESGELYIHIWWVQS